ncbi:hypothetical protein M9H77_07874 [Catharanthus roseus]|uniref:Uncharacterized protein n=1 Tax=Catharanthus roseus TaxID=4058 RepID=A0ACC0BW57_CATRO|nr:hypothetical protein M9H77_07874 [Catharanthus roseus]
MKDGECLIENYKSLKEKEKQDEIQKSEETKKEKSLMIFEGDKREQIKQSCCDISSSVTSLSSEEEFLFLKLINPRLLRSLGHSFPEVLAIKLGKSSSSHYRVYVA